MYCKKRDTCYTHRREAKLKLSSTIHREATREIHTVSNYRVKHYSPSAIRNKTGQRWLGFTPKIYLGTGYLPRSINNLISLKISYNETSSVVWLLFPSEIATDAFLFPQPLASNGRDAIVDDFSHVLAHRRSCSRHFFVCLCNSSLPNGWNWNCMN